MRFLSTGSGGQSLGEEAQGNPSPSGGGQENPTQILGSRVWRARQTAMALLHQQGPRVSISAGQRHKETPERYYLARPPAKEPWQQT